MSYSDLVPPTLHGIVPSHSHSLHLRNSKRTMSYKTIRLIGGENKADHLLKKYHVFGNTFKEIGEDNICMGIFYENWAEKLYKFKVRNDDTFLCGFPRSGTTWTQEMIWMIINNLDFEGAKEIQAKRTPFLELDAVFQGPWPFPTDNSLEYIDGLKSPRVIKSHLHWSLLPQEITNGSKQPKIIFVLRNPKDVCVSFYHLNKNLNYYTGTFEDFCEQFLAGRVNYGQFWKYVLSFWKERHRPNILFIKYKDMIDDHPSVIKRVSGFLGKQLSEEDIEILSKYLQFDNLKQNCVVNQHHANDGDDFFRVGKLDGHLTMMPPELIERFDAWTRKQLQGSDLVLD